MSYYRQQLEQYLSGLSIKADTVIDVGGEQKPVKGRTLAWEVDNYHILDLPSYDLTKPNSFSDYMGLADYVFCLEVFEYLIEPVKAMLIINRLLNRQGRAIMSFPLIYPAHNEVEVDSLRFTESGIKRILRAAHLKADSIHYRTDRSGLLQTFYASDGMRAAKSYPHHNATGFIVEAVKLW